MPPPAASTATIRTVRHGQFHRDGPQRRGHGGPGLQVEGPTDQLITIYRGVERESYSCMPICQQRVTLGDGDKYFKSAIEQAGSLSSQASGSAAAAGKSTN